MNVRHSNRAPAILAFGLTVASLIGFGCGEEAAPTDYTSSHREAFLSACARPIDDPRLLSEVCSCAYDRIKSEVPFREFVTVDDQLIATSLEQAESSGSGNASDSDNAANLQRQSSTLPTEINKIVADCFVEEADL